MRVKVSCTRTQHNVPGQGSNLDYSIRPERSALHNEATVKKEVDKGLNFGIFTS